jgi:hypothetical protein
MQTMTAGERRGKSKDAAAVGRTPSVIVWRPEVVLAGGIAKPERRLPVTIAEPHQRPESVRARVETAQSVFDTLAGARESLTSRLTLAQDRARTAQTERDRVSATIDAYRLEAKLDEVLTVTSTQVSMLMKERGLR